MLACQLKEVRYRTRQLHAWKESCLYLREFLLIPIGIFESNVFATDKMKSVIQQEFLKQCQVVLQTELNSCNNMKGIRMLAVPLI